MYIAALLVIYKFNFLTLFAMNRICLLLSLTVILSSCVNLNGTRQDEQIALKQARIQELETITLKQAATIDSLRKAAPPTPTGVFASGFPSKMDVFYIGVENPFEIDAVGVPAEKISVSISNGAIINASGSKWKVVVKSPGETVVRWSANIEGKTVQLGSRKFRVKRVPDPRPVLGNGESKHGGVISKSSIVSSTLRAEIENFDFDLKFQIVGFSVSATVKGLTQTAESKTEAFTAEQKKLINSVPMGGKLYIEDIKVRCPDGSVRQLDALKFTVR